MKAGITTIISNFEKTKLSYQSYERFSLDLIEILQYGEKDRKYIYNNQAAIRKGQEYIEEKGKLLLKKLPESRKEGVTFGKEEFSRTISQIRNLCKQSLEKALKKEWNQKVNEQSNLLSEEIKQGIKTKQAMDEVKENLITRLKQVA